MNQYSNFLRLVPLDGPSRSLHTPSSLTCLPVRPGDSLRVLLPKTDLLGLTPELCRVVLLKDTVLNVNWIDVGNVRVQQSELYTHIRLLVNETPSEGNYRQFALTRDNGKEVIGTFREQHQDMAQYMLALKNFYEAYPYAPVIGEVNGNVLSLRIFKTGRFRLTDEPLQVGPGTVLESNSNTPSIKAKALNTVTRSPQTTYQLRVGKDIQPGNKFLINGVSYLAVLGDTPDKILTILNGASQLLTVESGTLGETQALAGERTVQNTTRPTVIPQWLSKDTTFDYYKIKVLGNWQKGNVIQVTATGKTTITHTVTDADTLTTLEAVLNPDASQYKTALGVVPVITVVAGSQKVANTNFPTLTAQIVLETPSQLMRRWQISVSPDIQPGNSFYLEDKSYTAGQDDNAATIAQALGLTGAYSVITRPNGQAVVAYAKKGKKYGSDHVTDVQILEGPYMRKSRQVIMEVTIPDAATLAGMTTACQQEYFQLGLVDKRNGELRAVSNYLSVGAQEENCLLEVLAPHEVFGYEYYEPGLSQRLRLPVSLGTKQPFLEAETGVGMDGYQRKRSVTISQVVELVSDQVGEAFCETLTAWLQHEEVVIDGEEYSMREGMETPVLSNLSKSLQFSTRLTASGNLRHNRGRYLTQHQLGYGRLEWLPPTHGLQMMLIEESGQRQPIVRDMAVRAGEYSLEVMGAADEYTIEVFVSGESRAVFLAPKLVRSRPRTLIRIEPHGLTTLRISTTQAEELTYTCAADSLVENVAYSCEIVQKDASGEFNDNWSEDFTI